MAAPEPRRVQFSTGCCFSWKMLFRFRLAAAIPSTISVTRRSVSPCFFAFFLWRTWRIGWLVASVIRFYFSCLSPDGHEKRKKERKNEKTRMKWCFFPKGEEQKYRPISSSTKSNERKATVESTLRSPLIDERQTMEHSIELPFNENPAIISWFCHLKKKSSQRHLKYRFQTNSGIRYYRTSQNKIHWISLPILGLSLISITMNLSSKIWFFQSFSN